MLFCRLSMKVLVFGLVLFMANCDNTAVDNSEEKAVRNDDAVVVVAEEDLLQHTKDTYKQMYNPDVQPRWSESTHNNIAYICAKKLGLSDSRADIIKQASEMPDVYQSGIDNEFNQQWSHAYIYISWGFWIWGDADDDFHDNLDGDSGESESPEGYNGKWAGYYYNSGDRDLGDWYLGYAIHYIEDVNFILHSTVPNWDMLIHHFDYEKWVKNNWDSGHMLRTAAESVTTESFYVVSDPKEAIRKAAKISNYSLGNGNSKKAWDAYEDDGYPTGSGTGSSTLVTYTKKMITEATKWTGGTIEYALDKYGQW